MANPNPLNDAYQALTYAKGVLSTALCASAVDRTNTDLIAARDAARQAARALNKALWTRRDRDAAQS